MSHDRLVALFREASELTGSEREEFVQRVRAEDAELGATLAALLGGEQGSLADRIKEQYGSEADPHISLEGNVESDADFTSEIVQRLAGRGDAFGRYRLKGEVARGGQGVVLRVWDEDLRRNLAMKVVLGKGDETGETPKVDSRTLGRFLEEAQVTGQLDHPGIVPVHELGLDSVGQVYFTMKLVKGEDLRSIFDKVKSGEDGWSLTRALGALLKVCEAMAYAHSKGVIHRDLKPGNVMVGKYGEVYVMDWGLARVIEREDEKDVRIRPDPPTTELHSERRERATETPDSPLVTMDGDVVGTPAYMSPEQAMGDLDAMGPRSDVYGVGAMLYHLLAGHMPYVPPGRAITNYAIWQLVQDGPPRGLRATANAPAELVAICDKAMSRDQESRYDSVVGLSEDIQSYLEGRVVRAYRTGLEAELHSWVRRKPLHASVTCSALLAVPVLLVFAWSKASDEMALIRGRFVLESTPYMNDFRRSIAAVQEQVYATAAFFESSSSVTQEEFSAFTARGLERNASLRSISWFAEVGETETLELKPRLHAGSDLLEAVGSSPSAREFLDLTYDRGVNRGLDRGSLSVSDAFSVGTDGQLRVLAAVAPNWFTFLEKRSPSSVTVRDSPGGLVVGVIDVHETLNQLLPPGWSMSVQLLPSGSVDDISAASAESTIVESQWSGSPSPLSLAEELQLGGRLWRIRCTAPQSFLERNRTWTPITVVSMAFVPLLLLAVTLLGPRLLSGLARRAP